MSLIITLLSAWLLALSGGPLSFDAADAAFERDADYAKSCSLLLEMLPKAETPAQKAEVYWRLSRAENMLGEGVTTKEEKRKHFGQGIRYAEEAIAADPKNYNGYMWHCANVGRDVQTKPLTQQTSAVPVMIKYLDTIFFFLMIRRPPRSTQAKSEIYFIGTIRSNRTIRLWNMPGRRSVPSRMANSACGPGSGWPKSCMSGIRVETGRRPRPSFRTPVNAMNRFPSLLRRSGKTSRNW